MAQTLVCGLKTVNHRLKSVPRYAVRTDFCLEVLQSSYLAVVAAILPIHSDMFRIRARGHRTSRSIQRNGHGDLAAAAMSAVFGGWLRSGEVGN